MRALIVVDIQNDFCLGGALEIPGGDEVIPVANAVMEKFSLVVATREWHPANHVSFAANHPWRRPGNLVQLDGEEQMLWTMHCVQGSFGAEFAPGLDTSKFQKAFAKGIAPQLDNHSGFFDKGRKRSTGLEEYLREKGVEEVYVLGLSPDNGVRFTVLDALELGFRTYLVSDGVREADLEAGDSDLAVKEMREKGAIIVKSSDIEG
ncbi:MAG: bifunctional nicotinamidase/pyrazinamidase [Phaeodactylibacter sp.]|nr:bifunctional nicotinamidase/pyrazinamidase [Phaeodactylibacter sp.]MCB9050221.1 bifunctional nicotinamidase/pyrazinamidase [Lewinellaceae bacterium]